MLCTNSVLPMIIFAHIRISRPCDVVDDSLELNVAFLCKLYGLTFFVFARRIGVDGVCGTVALPLFSFYTSWVVLILSWICFCHLLICLY